jgi:hypothetical protein
VVRHYNNLQKRGDCQNSRKSHKTACSVGWVVGWKNNRCDWRRFGRSAKAQSRTADAHDLEDSDRAIVSMNQPNKEERSSAEVGEKRAWAKESIVHSKTDPTQSGACVSHGFERCGELQNSFKFAIEIRNRNWLDAEFATLLRDRSIALVLQDRSWMPSPSELKFDPITAGWTYIRWLGDRKAIEQQTMTWDKTIVDRSAELSSWVDFCYQVRKRGVLIYAFANNHFSGHAPATIEQFRSIWQSKGFPPLDAPRTSHRQPSLFSA